MKKSFIASAVISVALAITGVFIFWVQATPPTNQEVILKFNEHRRTFDVIRAMLQEDKNVRQIATWGIRTQDSMIDAMPPVPDLSLARYKKYLTLLSSAQALAASRSSGDNPDSCIYVWASGWAADTNHVALCWRGSSNDRSMTSGVPETNGRFIFYPVTERWFIQKEV